MVIFSIQFGFALFAFVFMESIAYPSFKLVKAHFKTDAKYNRTSIVKGVIERLVVYLGLLLNFAPILILFGALKIATRIKEDDEKISNDYFLIGNFLSVLLVLLAVILNHLIHEIYFDRMIVF